MLLHKLLIVHTIWREIFAGQNFRGLAVGKDFAKNFPGLTITILHSYWVYSNHTHITRESAVMASKFSVKAMVHGYHIY